MTTNNIIETIWENHVVHQQPGYPTVFAIDNMLIHEVTSAQAFQVLRERNIPVRYPTHLMATLDHSIPTDEHRIEFVSAQARKQVDTLRKNAPEFGVPLYDFGSQHQGIVHVTGPELGFTLPGTTLVCGDSHTATHGAFGALAFGIGTTEVGHVLATGCLLQEKPNTMRVQFNGMPPPGVTAKDVILALIATVGIGGAKQHVIEYTGEYIQRCSMEERMTICNMSIECGARAGLISPDETTFAYLKGRRYAPLPNEWHAAVHYWQSIASTPQASYDQTVEINLESLTPMITWGTNPAQAIPICDRLPDIKALPKDCQISAEKAYAYTKLSPGKPIIGTPIQWAFVGSCTNGRLSDLIEVAAILKGQQVAKHVTFYIVPGSEQVYQAALEQGLIDCVQQAGAIVRRPGCSMCLGMNADRVPPGERCISSSNRNFIGRQGPQSITHLASPATVAASAIAGYISTVTTRTMETHSDAD